MGFFFFFQAEDGIRDIGVTGVQTCALPILSLETSLAGRGAVIALNGELDLAGAAALEHELARVESEYDGAVVLDLRGVGFMDSSGLRMIALAAQRAQSLGRRRARSRQRAGDARVRDHADARAARLRRRPARRDRRAMRYAVDLARDPESPAEARRALGEVSDRLWPRRLEDARLLVWELGTNAIRHADLGVADVITLVVVTGDRALRIEVRDPGPGFEPRPPDPDPARPSGWGLYLVRELSDRWGVDRAADNRVWF